jgi:hypothetical protein
MVKYNSKLERVVRMMKQFIASLNVTFLTCLAFGLSTYSIPIFDAEKHAYNSI